MTLPGSAPPPVDIVPWYGLQNLVTGLQSSTLDSLKVRPDDFVGMLHAKGQFRLVRQLLEPGGVSRGFASRPMYLLERM
jgi:hypothetical protein